MEFAIEAGNIYKRYGNVNALNNLTLNIKCGKTFGFLGPNGAGKTTFVKIILDLISPDSGSSKIFGIDSKDAYARKKVGFLPENMSAYPFLSIEEYLKYHVKLIGLSPRHSKMNIEDCLKKTGMYNNRKKKMGVLSKGMRQRAGIAQALLGDPDLLILDEPTSGLDPVGIKDMRDILLDLKNDNKTIFLNSHLLSEIERTCDSIAILKNGKIIHTSDQTDFNMKEEYLELRVTDLSDSLAEKINSISVRSAEKHGDSLKVFLKSKNESIKIHEIVVQSNSELISLAWKGESLEEIFYRLVKEDK